MELNIRNRRRITKLRFLLGFKLSDKPNSSDYFNKKRRGLYE